VHSRRAIVARARPSDSRWRGEALDVGAARPEHRHPVFGAPGQVLAQVERVSVAGEAAVAGQEPCQRQLLGGAEQLVSRDERRACRDGNVHGGPPSVDAEAPVAGIGQAAPALIRGRRPYVWPARSLQSIGRASDRERVRPICLAGASSSRRWGTGLKARRYRRDRWVCRDG